MKPGVRRCSAASGAPAWSSMIGLPFDVRIASLGPEFPLVGATISQVDGRQVGAWMYRARGSETVLVESFAGEL